MMRTRGFTLIELLLYVSLASLILFGITMLIATVLEARVRGDTASFVEREGTNLLIELTDVIRNADSITTPTVSATSSTLELVYALGALDPTVVTSASGTVFIEQNGVGVEALTSPHVVVSQLTFVNASRSGTEGTVRVQFTMSAATSSDRFEYAYTKTFYGSGTLKE